MSCSVRRTRRDIRAPDLQAACRRGGRHNRIPGKDFVEAVYRLASNLLAHTCDHQSMEGLKMLQVIQPPEVHVT